MRDQQTDGRAETAPRATGPDICVILNPGSGKKTGTEPHDLRAEFDRHPGRFELRIVSKDSDPGREAERAVSDGFSTVVAAGGDGTICGIAEKVAGTEVRLGVLSLGTFNYFARGLHLPEELGEAVDVIAAGHVETFAPGEVNGRLFLNNASLGLYPAILRQRETTYKRWGRSRLVAHASALMTFLDFYRPISLKVTVDGVAHRARTPLVFLARSAHQLELFELDGAECVREGRFALYLAPDVGRWRLILFALRLAWGHPKAGRDFELICGEEILIETRRRRRLVARDGERERMTGPFRFRVLTDALKVVVPTREAS